MTVLVTGANGFVGAWTLKRLLEQGLQVVGFDLGDPGWLVRRLVGEHPALRWRRGDIGDAAAVSQAIADCGGVIHLAGLLTPACRDDPRAGMRVNVLGTINVFESARLAGLRRVVYASSAGVYGPVRDDCPEPTTHYGAFKLAAEGCARACLHDHGITSVGLRPFVVYGPGRESGASAGISLACLAALERRPYVIPFTGPAGMIHVDDVVDALCAGLTVSRDDASVWNLVGVVHDVTEVIEEIRRHHPQARLDCAGPPLQLSASIAPSPLAELVPGARITPLSDGIARTLAVFGGAWGR